MEEVGNDVFRQRFEMEDKKMKAKVYLLAIISIILISQSVMAAKPMPPYWLEIIVGGAQLHLRSDAKPPASLPDPIAVVAPGQGVNLRAKMVGGRRAYMMWPRIYGNVGPNTTIDAHGYDRMMFTVNNGSYHATGEWTVKDERYGWNCKGGSINPNGASTLEKVIWRAPMKPGIYSIRVIGFLDLHYVRITPAGKTEKDEKSGKQSAEFKIKVDGNLKPVGSFSNSQKKVLKKFFKLPTGPMMNVNIKGYKLPSGSLNNIYSVFNDKYDDYVCGAWQGKVLEMLDGMRVGADKKLFDNLDYGPIQAYWGMHQAVVIYPKGTDWRKTGTVLDPWVNQHPETFTIKEWNKRFKVGVGPSGVYQGAYPLNGGKGYPAKHLSIPSKHMKLLKRCSKKQREQYMKLKTKTARQQFIDKLPSGLNQSTAVVVHCPVKMLLEDDRGRRVGWLNNTFLHEIPGVDMDMFPEADGSSGLMLMLPLADYKVTIEGNQSGAFTFTRALPKQVTNTPLTDVRNVKISQGEIFHCEISPTKPNSKIISDKGQSLTLVNVLKEDSQPKPPVQAKPPVQPKPPGQSKPQSRPKPQTNKQHYQDVFETSPSHSNGAQNNGGWKTIVK